MTKKITKTDRENAKKKIQEIEASIEKFREEKKAEMMKLADQYDLSFFYQGEGRYYGGRQALIDDEFDPDDGYVEPGGWHDSACY